MPLNLPNSAQEIATKSKTDVQRSIPESNPFLKNSVLGALVTSFANRLFDFYIQLRFTVDSLFLDTAIGDSLERWAAIFGKTRLGASTSSGNVVATGTDTTLVPLSTTLTASDGSLYDTTANVNITATTLIVTSLNRSGSTVTTVTAIEHGLANNVLVDIGGAVEPEYNVSGTNIIVVSPTSFTYTIVGTPSTPATGTILADHTSIPVPIISQESGAATNLAEAELISLQSPIVGVDNDMSVDLNTIGGGTDQETDDDLRNRALEKVQNPTAHFNVSDIQQVSREVPGVTRVFVQEVTPAVGDVTVYFMRDNDDNPIPDGSEVATVRAKIIAIKPANTSDASVFVFAPTPLIVNFTFSSLTPNTSTMLAGVTASLDQFFAENTVVSVNIDEDAYRAAIATAVSTTGETVSTFTLSTPSGDIVIASGEIGVLGVVA